MQHFPKNCFHFPESSVKFASSTKNEVRKFGEVRSSSSTEILICNPGGPHGQGRGDVGERDDPGKAAYSTGGVRGWAVRVTFGRSVIGGIDAKLRIYGV